MIPVTNTVFEISFQTNPEYAPEDIRRMYFDRAIRYTQYWYDRYQDAVYEADINLLRKMSTVFVMDGMTVSFVVDLRGRIPSQLQNHDYPIEAWASQFIFDMFFNRLENGALFHEGMEAVTDKTSLRDDLMLINNLEMALYRLATKSMTVKQFEAPQ